MSALHSIVGTFLWNHRHIRWDSNPRPFQSSVLPTRPRRLHGYVTQVQCTVIWFQFNIKCLPCLPLSAMFFNHSSWLRYSLNSINLPYPRKMSFLLLIYTVLLYTQSNPCCTNLQLWLMQTYHKSKFSNRVAKRSLYLLLSLAFKLDWTFEKLNGIFEKRFRKTAFSNRVAKGSLCSVIVFGVETELNLWKTQWCLWKRMKCCEYTILFN